MTISKTYLTTVHSIAPLLIGGLIYISFRSTSLRMFEWFNSIGLQNSMNLYRYNVSGLKDLLPQWVYFSLPDGLWVYSFSSALIIFWNNDIKKIKFWLLIPCISGILVELLQSLKFFPGTFDIADLIFTILGLLLSIIIINHKFKQHEKQTF